MTAEEITQLQKDIETQNQHIVTQKADLFDVRDQLDAMQQEYNRRLQVLGSMHQHVQELQKQLAAAKKENPAEDGQGENDGAAPDR